MNKAIFVLLLATSLVIGCSRNKAVDPRLRFIKATMTHQNGPRAPEADTLFHYFVPFRPEASVTFVYVANPGCSFCIARAIDCCNAWADSGTEGDFVFLVKSDYTELFEFYLERDSKKTVPYFSSPEEFDLDDGLYTVRNGCVTSYDSWQL